MNVIENGKDSLKKAIQKLNILSSNPNNRSNPEYEFMLKDIVINLHHSIETIFKHMIKEKNEFLLYSNCEEIFKSRVLKNSNVEIKTIQFLDAVHRVFVLYNIDVKKENYNKFKSLNEIRNSLTHYERDFSNNEIEHLTALLLPVLLEIFKTNIDKFDGWAKENNLYNDVKKLNKEIEVWSLEKYFLWSIKYQKAFDEIERLNNNPIDKKSIFLSKDKTITYLDCPVCKNKLFHPTGNFIVNADDIIYLGDCKYCRINIDKSDAQFVSLYYSDLECISDKITAELEEIMMDSLFFSEIDKESKWVTIQILYNKERSLKKLRIELFYYINEMLEDLVSSYYDTFFLSENDTMEEIIEHENACISITLDQINSRMKFDDYSIVSSFKIALEIFDMIKKLYPDISEDIETKYIFNFDGYYLNFEGENVFRTIDCDIDFDMNYIRELLEE